MSSPTSRGPTATSRRRRCSRSCTSTACASPRPLPAGWLQEHRLDGLAEIGRLGAWLERLGAGVHHRGEVTVAVACEVLDAAALLDDHQASRVLRSYGVTCHGTVWLAADAVSSGRISSPRALDGFFGSLIAHGARLPFASGSPWATWAQRQGLLPSGSPPSTGPQMPSAQSPSARIPSAQIPSAQISSAQISSD